MKRSLTILFTLFALTMSALGITTPAVAAEKTADLPSAAEFLNADGTLNLSAGYSGSLDISNYTVTLDPARGPLFSPPQTLTPNAWNALGIGGLSGFSVYAIAISGTDVYVGGDFLNAGGDANADKIAKWNGSAWSALGGTPLNGTVTTIAINGTDVYVGGFFTNAGGDVNANKIAKWNGSAWSALGNGLDQIVRAITISGTDVYVGGGFTNAGADLNADYIAKWNGSAWSALGGTALNNWVYTIATSGTDVYAGGLFLNAGGDANADYIAKWNGSAWSALGGTPLNNYAEVIAISGTEVYAGGVFTDAGGDANADKIAKWNGSAWSALGTGLSGQVLGIAISGTDVYVGGGFNNAGGDANADNIAKWNDSAWSALGGTPLNSYVNVIAISGTDVYAGGYFDDAGGDANADRIAVFGGPDTTAPTVDIFTATSPSSSLAIPITGFTASDNAGVTGYKVTESSTAPSASDLGWAGTAPTTYTVAADGNYTLYPWAKDAAGNVSPVFGSPASVTVDTTPPTVVSSVRANPNPTSAASVEFAVTFSEPLILPNDDDISHYILTTDGVTDAFITNTYGWSANTIIVIVNTGSGNGTIRLDVIDHDNILDLAGNPLGGTGMGNGDFTTGETYNIIKDSVSPTVSSITRANLNPTSAASVDFTVTFSESVTGVDISDFELTKTGVSGESITGMSGLGATYTVSVSTGSGDGTIRLDVLDNDSILDAASNPLNGGFTGGETYDVDKNDIPSSISLDVTSVAGNLPIGTVVGTFSSTDADLADTFTYSLVSGEGDTDNASFSIAGDQLQTAAVFDSNVKTSYAIFVRTTDDGVGNLFFEQAFTITVTANNITPSLLTPVNLELLIINRPTFDWTDVLGSISYRIQIYKTAGFAKSGKVVDTTTTSSTFTPPSDLPTGITLYWRVSRNTAAGAGPWSEIRSFTIAVPPSVPALIAPGKNGKNISLTPLFDWSDSTPFAGTTLLKYELQVSTDSAFTSPISVDAINSDYTLSTSLNPNTKHYWRVHACNTLGQCSTWSSVRSFTTIP